MILGIRTDQPNAELALCEGSEVIAAVSWLANRQLAESIHQQIDTLLQSKQGTLADISGIVVYQGPGSFTGLRIGISVANALAYALSVPIVGASTDNWIQDGAMRLNDVAANSWVSPYYGSPVHITQPRK